MNNTDSQLLNLCLEDSLFAALYPALQHLTQEWKTSSPITLWLNTLQAKSMLASSRRPELLLPTLLSQSSLLDGLLSQSLLLWMLFTEDPTSTPSPLRNALCLELLKHKEKWGIIYERFRKSEADNEMMGYKVESHDFSTPLPNMPSNQPNRTTHDLHDFIMEAIHSEDIDACRSIHYILSRFDISKKHIYEEEEIMLNKKMDEWNKMQHEAKHMENHFEANSCRFDAGSSMNGNVIF